MIPVKHAVVAVDEGRQQMKFATRQADIFALGDEAFAVFMRNHGITFCGRSVEHAAMIGVFLEKACRRQLDMAATGLEWSWPDEEESALRTSQVLTEIHIRHSWDYYCRKLDWWTASQTSAAQGLFGPA